MAISAIVITHDPVRMWERYTRVLTGREFSNYSHKLRALGWFWDCEFTMRGGYYSLQEFLENGLGRHVQCFGDQSIYEPAWEGKITELELNLDRMKYKVGLSDFANEMWARRDSAGTPVRTTVRSDASSVARFGTKNKVISAGIASDVAADQAVRTELNLISWPATPNWSDVIGQAQRTGAEASLRVKAVGYWQTLGWQIYNQATAGDDVVSNVIAAILSSKAQFIAGSEVSRNDTIVSRRFDGDRTALDIITSLVGFGDVLYSRWVAGVKADRIFFYRQAAQSRLS